MHRLTTTAFAACHLAAMATLIGLADRSVALAQGRPPARGPLFAGDTVTAAPHEILDLRVSLAGGTDDNLGVDAGTSGSPLDQTIGGRYADLSGSLRLAVTRPRFVLETVATGAGRHYPGLDSFVGSNESARSTMLVALGRKTTLRTSLDASYLSTVAFDTFADKSSGYAGGSSTNDVDGKTLEWTTEQRVYGGALEVSRMLRKQLSFSLVGAGGHSDRRTLGQRNDQGAVSALVRKRLGRESSLTASYSYHRGIVWFADISSPVWSQDAQLSAEQRWRQSKFRSTLIRVSGGPSLLHQRLTVADPTADSGLPPSTHVVTERLLGVIGSVTLAEEMRNWSVQGWYRRGASVRDGVLYSNTAGLDLLAQFGARVSLSTSAGYTDGDIGLGALRERRYGTTFGSARLQVALARFVAVQSQYFLYRYEYGADARIPEGARRRSNRRGLRVGLVFWAPVHRG